MDDKKTIEQVINEKRSKELGSKITITNCSLGEVGEGFREKKAKTLQLR